MERLNSTGTSKGSISMVIDPQYEVRDVLSDPARKMPFALLIGEEIQGMIIVSLMEDVSNYTINLTVVEQEANVWIKDDKEWT